MSTNGDQPETAHPKFPFGEKLDFLIEQGLNRGRPLPEIIFTLEMTLHDLKNRFIRDANAKAKAAAVDQQPVVKRIIIENGGKAE